MIIFCIHFLKSKKMITSRSATLYPMSPSLSRVLFEHKRHRNFFLPYWLIVKLPNGAILREMLRLVRKSLLN
ncbi:MAG: hypothetical protein HeimC2_27820 [Candidatus Heimdallarchaeota archaeon LC_2]|nr:MAG: hypothetical protein HeimC2_27820 [Candidatus Heimdallarchaeota archaeon LC_2]